MMTTATAKTKRADRLAPDVPDEPKALTSDEIRTKIEVAERLVADEKTALARMGPAREALFENGASEGAIVEHDEHTCRLEIRIRLAAAAVRKLEDELAIAEAAEAEAERKALHVKALGLKNEYVLHLGKADTLAQAIAVELRAAAEIEEFFRSRGLDVSELQDFRDDRPRQSAEPARIETIREEVIDRDPVVGYVGQPGYVGPRYVTRERRVEHPYRPAEQLPELKSLLKIFVLPALSATAAAHWDQPKPAMHFDINRIYA